MCESGGDDEGWSLPSGEVLMAITYEDAVAKLHECVHPVDRIFGGRVPPDDGTIPVSIAEERPWQGFGVRPRSGRHH